MRPSAGWWAALLVALAACSSPGKSTAVRGAGDGGDGGGARMHDAGVPDAAPQTPVGAAKPYLAAPASVEGSLQAAGALNVRVQWKDAPAALLRAAKRTVCGSQGAPALSVHTLHGVEHAVVMLAAVERGIVPPAPRPLLVEVDGCRLQPPTVIARRNDARIEVVSRDERRHLVTATRLSPRLDASAAAEPARELARFELPIIGSRAAIDPEGAAVVKLSLPGAGAPDAWVVISAHPYVAITDDLGAAAFAEVVPGEYEVIVWHRPLSDGEAPLELRLPVTIARDRTISLVADLSKAVAR